MPKRQSNSKPAMPEQQLDMEPVMPEQKSDLEPAMSEQKSHPELDSESYIEQGLEVHLEEEQKSMSESNIKLEFFSNFTQIPLT